MKSYKSIPVEVEAIQFFDTKESFDETKEIFGERLSSSLRNFPRAFFRVENGKTVPLYNNSWIVKKDNKLEILDDETFKKTYEEKG